MFTVCRVMIAARGVIVVAGRATTGSSSALRIADRDHRIRQKTSDTGH